jgi:APA family basic amino acid/polyamine antiporter
VLGSWLAQRHPETGVPARAIMLQTLWASVLILSGTFEQLIVYSGLVLAFFMCLTLSAIFPLRSRPDQPAGVYRIPGYPILPAVLVISSLLVVCSGLVQRPMEAMYGLVTVMAGVPFYVLRKRKSQDDLRETAENK